MLLRGCKKNVLYFAVVLFCVVFSGCANPLDEKNGEPARGRLTVYAGGLRKVLMPGGISPATERRSVMPGTPGFHHYRMTFTKGTETITTDNAADGQTVNLTPGTWDITVKAYLSTDDSVTAASGSATGITVTGGTDTNTTVTLNALPIETGAGPGTFVWDIDTAAITGTLGTATITLSPIAGTPIALDLTDTSVGFAGNRSVPAGCYDVVISLTKGDKSAGLYTAAWIYPNLTTTAACAFTDKDFAAIVMLSGTVAAVKPAGLGLTSISVNAYQEEARSTLIGTTEVAAAGFGAGVSSGSGTWFMAVPVSSLGADKKLWLTVSARDDDNIVRTARAGETGTIPDAGIRNLTLPFAIYTITDDSDIGGYIELDDVFAVAGNTVSLTVTPDPGNIYQSGTVRVNAGAVVLSGSELGYTFTMPDTDVTITAEFIIRHTIDIDSSIAGGTVSANPETAFAGDTITLTVMYDPNHVLVDRSLTVNNDAALVTRVGNDYEFIMPDADVTVNAEFFHGSIFYVKAGGTGGGGSWEGASGDLQAMMDDASAVTGSGAAQVRVAAGTYKPAKIPTKSTVPDPYNSTSSDTRDKVFILRRGVEVLGGYNAEGEGINETTRLARFNPDGTVINSLLHQAVLSGDVGNDDIVDGSGPTLTITNNSDNVYRVVMSMGIPANTGTILDGFTISGGNANGSASHTITVDTTNISPLLGGGMYNNNSLPELKRVFIYGNSVGDSGNGSGGGMYNTFSSPILTDVTISHNIANGNTGGGGMVNSQSSPVLNNVTISGNAAAYGGGMYNLSPSLPTSSVQMNGGLISGNYASGISTGNGGGGIYNIASSLVLETVIISGNTTGNGGGGGVYVGSGGTGITMNGGKISDNTANFSGGTGGGGVYIAGGGKFTMNGAEATGNNAISSGGDAYGGGVFNIGGTFTMSEGAAVRYNIAQDGSGYSYAEGGGVWVGASGSFTMTDGILSYNKADGNQHAWGGGLFVGGSTTITLNSGSINDNIAVTSYSASGGGIYRISGTLFDITDITVTGNTCEGTVYGAGSNEPEYN